MNGIDSLTHTLALGLAASAAIALLAWLASLRLRDVSIVDSVWSLMVVAPGLVAAAVMPDVGPRAVVVLPLAALWALRLAGYITWRHWGHDEDRRYREIRARNEPHFRWKSAYLVFGLQALLAGSCRCPWSLPSPAPCPGTGSTPSASRCAGSASRSRCWPTPSWLASRPIPATAAACWPAACGAIAATRTTSASSACGGASAWSRWPAGAWWAMASPLLMSVLLLRVSGVTLLEKDIGMRRPAYRLYVARTNAFFPWKPRA